MAQESVVQGSASQSQGEDHGHGKGSLGPILCWAVVFADIGTSVYYVPGILYLTVGSLAGFFVFLTMTVFVLLTLKYAEVTHRFPQGGGVVTVAAQAMNHWIGALGGMFILVDYFLTAAISCLSGMIYLAVVAPSIGPYTLWITVGVLVLLGLLNWVGISESAKVSLFGAIIAFFSDIAILLTVFTHISFREFLQIFERMFAGVSLTPTALLIGFAGSFLAFSGLESISQLSPVMRTPRKKIAGIALFLVVITIGLTSPLLTMFSTILLPEAAKDPSAQNQLISLLAGKWGSPILQTEVAISASALLIFASNTAIIGAYHVFMALSRMEFFPSVILKRNKLRGTPHYSIALATGIPILILIAVNGRIDILGDMYAFGLLGAFSLTCLGLDIVRWRERKTARQVKKNLPESNSHGLASPQTVLAEAEELSHKITHTPDGIPAVNGLEPDVIASMAAPAYTCRQYLSHFWHTLDFWLGVLTTFLVVLAWSTNLVSKPLATAFGGSVALVGMAIALTNYQLSKQQGRLPVAITTGVEGRMPGSVLAVLTSGNGRNASIIRTAVDISDGRPVVFLYLGEPKPVRTPRIFEVVDPYLDDQKAKEYFGKAENLAQKAKIQRRFVYRKDEPDAVSRVWRIIHPRDIVISADKASDIEDVSPDRIRYEITPNGKVAHLLKTW
ncbi:MAG TPA: APC family permease [Ktedonobacteraceae bacterium]|nr:APC family permease [Ktedonobacteraceae bacterium]